MDWEKDIYSKGRQLNRWPYSNVISTLFKQVGSDPPSIINVLEIGCGAGNNLVFLGQEGFKYAGVDFSKSAIDYARLRLKSLGILKDNRVEVADMKSLPFKDVCFNYVIDRGALTQNSHEDIKIILKEVHRVLKYDGKILSFDLYGLKHPDICYGEEVFPHSYDNFTQGFFQKVGLTSFFSYPQVAIDFSLFDNLDIKRHVIYGGDNKILTETFSVIGIKKLRMQSG